MELSENMEQSDKVGQVKNWGRVEMENKGELKSGTGWKIGAATVVNS